LIIADQTDWINPTIWEVRDNKNTEWKLVINERTVGIVINTIRLFQSTIADRAAGCVAIGEELDGICF
jgi:hypothetical protein